MKTALLFLLLCSTADAGKWEVRAHRQRNRQYENECGITARKWECRLNRSRALLNFSKPFNIWGWLTP